MTELKLPKLPTSGAMNKQSRRGTTSEDLFKIAEASGMGKEAQAILAEKGEEFDKFFAGGMVSDVFDVLNFFQYGVVGMAKGKSFTEGVRDRESWSKKDALGKFGFWGNVGGVLLDIASDPLTWFAPWTLIKFIPGVKQLGAKTSAIFAKSAKAAMEHSKLRKLVYMGGQSPVFRKGYETMTHGIAAGWKKAKRLGQAIHKLPVDGTVLKKAIEEGNEAVITKAGASAVEAWGEITKLQDRLYAAGVIGKEVIDETRGKYLPRVFQLFDNAQVKRVLKKGGPKAKVVKKLSKATGFDMTKSEALYDAAQKFNPTSEFGKLSRSSTKSLNRLKSRHDAYGVDYIPVRGKKRLTKKFESATQRDNFVETLGDQANVLRKFDPIPEKYLQAMGEVTEAAYPTAKAIGDMTELAEKAEFFNTLSASPLIREAAEGGFKALPSDAKYFSMSGKFVPESMHEYLTEIIEPRTRGFVQKAIAGFKFGKVIMNPPTHARNIVSNVFLNGMEGMRLSNPRTWKNYGRAMKELALGRKGKSEWMKSMQETYGVGLDSMASREVRDILLGPDGMSIAGKAKEPFRKTARVMADAYETEETFAKLASFMHHAETMGAKNVADLAKGIDAVDHRIMKALDISGAETIGEAAARIAERSTFNYAQVSPFVRQLRESVFGMPFITFTAKATPQVAKTIAKHPNRLSWIGKARNAIENASDIELTKKEKAAEPQWVKDGLFVKLPMKDKHGRSAYFDLTYIIPFGEVMSGQLFQRQIDRETGLPESQAEAILKKAPFINLITEIGKNQDFYGNKIWNNSDSEAKRGLDLFRHVAKTYAPPIIADAIPGGIRAKGRKTGQRKKGPFTAFKDASEKNQLRTGTQEILRQFGAKITPVNVDVQEGYKEWESKRALETLLKEKGVMRDVNITIPKK